MFGVVGRQAQGLHQACAAKAVARLVEMRLIEDSKNVARTGSPLKQDFLNFFLFFF